MTKEQFKEALVEKIGGTSFGDEIIEELTVDFDPQKYAQNAKDKLDDRTGTILGWAHKYYENGEYAKAAAEYEKACVVMKALEAIK